MGIRAPRRWSLTTALCIGTMLNPLNSSMIAVALVTLRDEFGLDLASVLWIVTGFYLASATAQPLMGRLADRFGPKRLSRRAPARDRRLSAAAVGATLAP